MEARRNAGRRKKKSDKKIGFSQFRNVLPWESVFLLRGQDRGDGENPPENKADQKLMLLGGGGSVLLFADCRKSARACIEAKN